MHPSVAWHRSAHSMDEAATSARPPSKLGLLSGTYREFAVQEGSFLHQDAIVSPPADALLMRTKPERVGQLKLLHKRWQHSSGVRPSSPGLGLEPLGQRKSPHVAAANVDHAAHANRSTVWRAIAALSTISAESQRLLVHSIPSAFSEVDYHSMSLNVS